MKEEVNTTKNLTLYSQKAIGIATFIGGPMAAGYLIRKNYLALNESGKGKNALVIGIATTIALFFGIFLLPESIIERVPNLIVHLTYTAIILFIVGKIHGSILKAHKEHNNDFASVWKAVVIGFVSLFLLVVATFCYILLAP